MGRRLRRCRIYFPTVETLREGAAWWRLETGVDRDDLATVASSQDRRSNRDLFAATTWEALLNGFRKDALGRAPEIVQSEDLLPPRRRDLESSRTSFSVRCATWRARPSGGPSWSRRWSLSNDGSVVKAATVRARARDSRKSEVDGDD